MDEWLWMDTDTSSRGLHLVNQLPSEQPVQVTHVWGWSETQLVRARVDIDLPGGGVVGAVLTLAEGDEGVLAQVWKENDGRINAVYPPSLTARSGLVRLHAVDHPTRMSDGELELSRLQFLKLEP